MTLARLPIRKCDLVWSAAAVLLLASYVSSAPLVGALVMTNCGEAHGALLVYTPLFKYLDSDLPGARFMDWFYAPTEIWAIATLEGREVRLARRGPGGPVNSDDPAERELLSCA